MMTGWRWLRNAMPDMRLNFGEIARWRVRTASEIATRQIIKECPRRPAAQQSLKGESCFLGWSSWLPPVNGK